MAKKNNRTCIVCGSQYSYCPSCSEDRNKENWYAIYCSNNCKLIFEAASDFLSNDISKEEAKEKFEQCDLSNKENFHHKIVEAIEKAYVIEDSLVETESAMPKILKKSAAKKLNNE